MRHVGFVERSFRLLLEVLVEDVDHRALTQRRQGLVCGLCDVDPNSRLVRIGQYRLFQPSGVIIRIRLIERLPPLRKTFPVSLG